MLKDLTYITFDFETTWLDLKKDEPIQFGLVKFDKNFNILDKFSTYIKPKKQISELKDIVSFITWLNLKDLQNAPYIEEVLPEIKKFFDDKTVILGHNIEFDYKMLKKYRKDFKFLVSIDTFIIAKTIFHFFPSYSLEVLFEFIKEDLWINLSEYGEAHDALVDSMMVYHFFKYSVNYLENLLKKYPVILTFIQKSESFWSKIIDFSYFEIPKTKNYFLPKFKKQIPWFRKIHFPKKFGLDNYDNFAKIDLSKINIVDFVSQVLAEDKKVILAVSNKWKLQILKQILDNLGVIDRWYLSSEFIFSEDRIQKFLQKDKFEDFEINFLIKYFSQVNGQYTILDVTSFGDYKILEFLTEKREKQLPKLILTTHWWIFSKIEKWIDLKDYILFFLDWDWWYVSWSKFLNSPIDLYNFLNKLETILYQLKFLAEEDLIIKFEKLLSQFVIFMWVFFIQLTKKFKWLDTNKIEIWPIKWDIDFWQTNKLFDVLTSQFVEIWKDLMKFDEFLQDLNDVLLNLKKIFENVILVEKKMFQENKFYFVFYLQDKIINYQSFLEFLDWKFKKVLFGKV